MKLLPFIPYLVWLATKSYLMANMSVYTMVASLRWNRMSSQSWLSFLLYALAARLTLARQPCASCSPFSCTTNAGRHPRAPVPWIQNFLAPLS